MPVPAPIWRYWVAGQQAVGAGSDGDMTSDLRMISSSVGDRLSVMRGWYPGYRPYVQSLRLSRHIHRVSVIVIAWASPVGGRQGAGETIGDRGPRDQPSELVVRWRWPVPS